MAQRKKAAAGKSGKGRGERPGKGPARGSKKAPEERAEAIPRDLSFEVALDRLENVVDRLERGDLELEESLSVFEEGVGLSKHCAAQLESAERRVEVLMREGGEWLVRPFAPEDDSEEI